jgi:hypothetical protein
MPNKEVRKVEKMSSKSNKNKMLRIKVSLLFLEVKIRKSKRFRRNMLTKMKRKEI